MVSFKENPNLGLKVVDTSTGLREYRANCRKIKDAYYVKNVDCFEVGGKWYRKDSGLIVFDEEKKVWVTKNYAMMNLITGVVGMGFNGKPIMGQFSPNPYANIRTRLNGGIGMFATVMNPDILTENGFVEDISCDTWYQRKDLSNSDFLQINSIRNVNNYGKKGYNIEDNSVEALEKTTLYEKYPIALSKDVRRYSRFLNDTTFGLELECSHGFVPDRLQNRMGVVVCRDGSLVDENGYYGPEFTTIPLSGAKGLQNIVNISNELKKRTVLNEKCSLHIHLGNLPTSRLFLVSLYILSNKIQDEIFAMFPGYKVDFKKAGKEKDYCQKLKPMSMGKIANAGKEDFQSFIDENYTKIFYWLSQNSEGSGYNPSKEWNRKKESHPVSQKWYRKNRYYWVNLMNALFSPRNTIEFRVHTPTVNSQKIINWLFICNAIVRYAIIHSKDILGGKKITLSTVLDYYKDTFRVAQAEFLSEYLKAYVKERTEKFAADVAKGDYLSRWDIDEDKTYEFKFGNVTHLF